MRYALLGGGLIVGGIAALIVASRHRPHVLDAGFVLSHPIGWSTTAYDAAWIGGAALLIFGAILVAFALVREIKR
jgi:hypothetical protein